MKRISKILVLMLIMSLLMGCLVSCKKEDENVFTVGFDAEFPPYGYKDDNGEYVGFDLSLAEEVCKRNGWTLKKQPIDWDSKDMELKSGTIDCIWNGFTINGREDLYTWSKAYVDNSQVVIVKSKSGIDTLEDLKGKVVIVQTDSSALAAFTGANATEANKALCAEFKELQQVSDYNSAFMSLEAGMADAICMDMGVANYQLAQRGNAFKMLKENVATELYGIGFKLGNTELRDKVQATLDEMLADGTFAAIAEEWGLSDSVCLGKEGTDSAYLNSGASKADKEKMSFTDRFVDVVTKLSEGMVASLLIFVLTLVFSLPLGLLICAVRMSKFKPLQWVAKIYISIMRGTPLMLQLIMVFFGPFYIFGVALPSEYRFYAVIIAFSFNYAAYFAEIYRSGIESIPVGQYEAASVLGYSKIQRYWKILFPQMVKRVIPPVTNEVITLVKDTSLAFAIAYAEMFTLAKQVAAAEASVMPLFIAGVFYYVFNFVVAIVMENVEKKFQYYR